MRISANATATGCHHGTMAARKNPASHYHGHVDSGWTPTPQPSDESFKVSLDGAEEVSTWLAEALRDALSKPDLRLADETEVWQRLVRQRETISTGQQAGPTITAVPMPDGECWCQRPSLREVSGKHRES